MAVHYLLQAFEASREAEQRALRLSLQPREAELKALQQQIHPHFLFNSLNSVNALTVTDPPAARAMVIRLADFLRTTLATGTEDVITLAEELRLADDYLAIEQVRFGKRLRVQKDIGPGVEACRVPALLLQPLLENAITHGIARLVEGGLVCLTARTAGHTLTIALSNPAAPDAAGPSAGMGVGLENVRRRLHTMYGRDGRMAVQRHAGTYVVELQMPVAAGRAEGR